MKCSDPFQCHVKKVVRPAIWSLFNVEKEMRKSPEVYLRQDKKAVNNKPEDEEKADFFQRELHRRPSHLCSALPPAVKAAFDRRTRLTGLPPTLSLYGLCCDPKIRAC